ILRGLDHVESVLEIGCGQGALGARLAGRYRYVGIEIDEASHALAAARVEPTGGLVLQGDISTLPLGMIFDLVCAFEVLEHIADDLEALRTWREFLRPGGWLLISVPAYQQRFGAADVRVGHHRRYDPEATQSLLEASGFVLRAALLYGFPLGYALEAARNRLSGTWRRAASQTERTRASGRLLQPPSFLGWLTATASLPFRILQRPFLGTRLGTGLVILARRAD
ncbi:MAG: class I SAM-dependent methyltransferase, partial [Acidimicrobiia bacterium]